MANDYIGAEVETLVAEHPEGDDLLENVSFYKEEKKNDPKFAKKLASPADVYVNDIFGIAHRTHASNEGVAKYLNPSVAGFLMHKSPDYNVDATTSELVEAPILEIRKELKIRRFSSRREKHISWIHIKLS